jgi:DNA-binding GntR family transcriptional regulator
MTSEPSISGDGEAKAPSLVLPRKTPAGLSSVKGYEAYLAVQRGIEEGRYPAGTRLKEVDLATDLGMSRTPIREAIRQLERDGVLKVVPNRGAVVRERTADEVEEIYALRAVLEGFCASRAAVRMDAMAIAHLAEVESELERRIRAGDDIDPLIRLNLAFHEAIVEGSQNTPIAEVLQRATAVPFAMKRAFWQSPRATQATIVHHRGIVGAISAHDAVRAEAAMRSHIFEVKDFFTGQQRAAGIQDLLQDPQM